MTDLDAAALHHFPLTARAGVAGPGQPHLGHQVGREVALRDHPDQVPVRGVGAGGRHLELHHGGIGDEAHSGQTDRSREALRSAGDLLDLLLRRELQVEAAEQVLQLDLVDLEVTPDQHGHELAVGLEDQGLDQVRGIDPQERGDLVDRPQRRACRPLPDSPAW